MSTVFKPSKSFLNKLEQWNALKSQLADLTEQERALRVELFGLAFPNPEEGSKYNKLDLPNGYMLQGDYKINRRVDEAALDTVRKQMDPIAFGRTFRFKPDLITAGLRDLSDDQRAIASQAIIAAPGTPTLAIVQKKK